jgi:hypothetical protein
MMLPPETARPAREVPRLVSPFALDVRSRPRKAKGEPHRMQTPTGWHLPHS